MIQFQQAVGKLAVTLPELNLIDTDDLDDTEATPPGLAADPAASAGQTNTNGRHAAQTPQSGRSGTAASPPSATLTPRT